MPDTRDEKERVREKAAAEHGIQLYRRYGERQAAEAIGWSYATLKRKRRAGLVPFVEMGGGSVGYMGLPDRGYHRLRREGETRRSWRRKYQ